LTQFGELSLWIALLMAAWCATLALQGALMRRPAFTESGVRGLYVSFVFTAFAAAALMTAFVFGDYAVRFVAMHSGLNNALLERVSAFWSAGAGVWMLLSLLLAAAASVAARGSMRREADRALAAWTVATLGLAVFAALAVTAFKQNPFALFPRVPTDGRGLDPVFRNPAMVIQPPLMLLGAACAVVSLAMAIARAIRLRGGGMFSGRPRTFAVASWGLLSAAFLIGAHWAYTSPGLQSRVQDTPMVIGSGVAWIVMTLFLIAAEVRDRRSPRSEAIAVRRRAGWVLAACGALLCGVVIAAHSRWKNYDAQIDDGSQYRAKDGWGHDWTFTSQGASRLERPGDDVTALALIPTRDGVRQPFLSSESRQYYGPGGLDIYPAQTVPAIRRALAQDLFVVLSDAGDGHAVLRISFRPLAELAWPAGVLLALGGLLFFWPPRTENSA
jgi:cytochrome c biogenesis factor